MATIAESAEKLVDAINTLIAAKIALYGTNHYAEDKIKDVLDAQENLKEAILEITLK
jgi:hypothetical protein